MRIGWATECTQWCRNQGLIPRRDRTTSIAIIRCRIEVKLIEERCAIEVRQDRHPPCPTITNRLGVPPNRITQPHRKHLIGIVVIVECQSQLFEIIPALGSASRFTRLLYCRQKQRNEHRDNRDDDE